MNLTQDEIFTYLECPVKYALKYNAKIEPEEQTLKQQYSEALHTTIYNFWHKILDGHRVSSDELKAKWESLWFKSHNINKMDIIYGTKNDKVELGNKGHQILQSFMRNLQGNPGVPICVAKSIMAPIGDHMLTGNIELVREVKENEMRILEVIDYKTGDTMPDQMSADRDLALTIQSYLFRRAFQAREQRLVYYYLKHGKPIYTIRDSQHFRTLMATVDSVAKAIENEIYYPRQAFTCKVCTYREYCDGWPT